MNAVSSAVASAPRAAAGAGAAIVAAVAVGVALGFRAHAACLTVLVLAVAPAAVLVARRQKSDSPGPLDGPFSCCACRRVRARRFAGHVSTWLGSTPTFDGILAGLSIDSLEPDGSVRASLIADWRLLSVDGFFHEGALALVVDSVTSIGQICAGYMSGLSIEIRFSLEDGDVPIQAGERLAIESRILKVRKGTVMVMQLEVRRAPALGAGGDEKGVLLASGTHTKSIKDGLAPRRERLKLEVAGKFFPLAWLLWRRDLQSMRAWAAETPPGEPVFSMEERVALREEGAWGDDGASTRFLVDVPVRLQNSFGIAHGGAIAAMLVAAGRAHLVRARPDAFPRAADVTVNEVAVMYQHPVPGFWTVAVVVSPRTVGKSAGEAWRGTVRLVASLQTVDGHELAKANLRAVLPEIPAEDQDAVPVPATMQQLHNPVPAAALGRPLLAQPAGRPALSMAMGRPALGPRPKASRVAAPGERAAYAAALGSRLSPSKASAFQPSLGMHTFLSSRLSLGPQLPGTLPVPRIHHQEAEANEREPDRTDKVE